MSEQEYEQCPNPLPMTPMPEVELSFGTVSSVEACLALGERLAKAILEIADPLPLDGYNDFHGYRYTTATTIKEYARKALAFHGICPVMSVKSIKREGDMTYLDVDFTLFFPEGWATFPWTAEASDTGDKGTGKAFTAALKFFLIALLQLPSDSASDIDAHEGRGKKPARRQRERKAQRQQGPPQQPPQSGAQSSSNGGDGGKGRFWPSETIDAIKETGLVKPWAAKHAINALNLSKEISATDAADIVVKWVQLYAQKRQEELEPPDAAAHADKLIGVDKWVEGQGGASKPLEGGDGEPEAEPEPAKEA